ncbi:MAG: hypothetical protein ACYC23_17005, partial [Limisphaerales bacterium]
AATVSGSTPDRWLRKDGFGNVLGYRSAPRIRTAPEFIARQTTPTARGVSANAKVWRVTLEWSETLIGVDPAPETW